MFYIKEDQVLKVKYSEYLKLVGSLSKLFSDSLVPYLYYRVAENIFCLAFKAENLSRSDVAIDAVKNNIGFGLKTFLHNNGKTFQKIAEFNALREEYKDKSDEEIVYFISEARNKRLDLSIEIYNCHKLIYHCLTRSENKMSIYEFPMDLVDIKNIKNIKRDKNSIKFTDGLNEYNFNLSKSTLFKRFICKKSIADITIDILAEPYDSLLSLQSTSQNLLTKSTNYPFVYLPLYAPSSKDFEPALASGINQWNAKGRKRDPNELYIPIPSWIHKRFINFFPNNNDEIFDLILPNGNKLSSKMSQSGQKSLMSDPNKALGKWILRDVLKVPEWTLLDRDYLNKIGIDSVIVFKLSDTEYKIDFASVGKFEEFKEQNDI